MNTASDLSETVRRILLEPTGGVAGLVDELVKLCCAHGLQLDWKADHCRLRSSNGDWESLQGVTLRKSVFRAALARIAALCNEQSPDSVSAYGGHGELAVGADPAAVCKVTFANSAAEQKLELRVESRQSRR